MSNYFTNKIVWITGASSGIGEALAYSFAEKGARLVLSSRRKEELERVKSNCKSKDVFILPLDLELASEMVEKTTWVIEHVGVPDILINNGGVSQRGNASETSLETDRRIMEINYFGNIALTKAVLPYMKNKKNGHIVVISSIAGKFGFYLRSAYSAAKHALHGFYESLRLEEEENGIKVLMVCPGKISTNISMHALNAKGEEHGKMDRGQNTGISAEQCANEIIAGILKNKEEILIGGREIKAVKVKRLFPKLFGKIIRKQPRE